MPTLEQQLWHWPVFVKDYQPEPFDEVTYRGAPGPLDAGGTRQAGAID